MKLKIVSTQYRFCDVPCHKEGMKTYTEMLLNANIFTSDIITSEDCYPNEIWFYVQLNQLTDLFNISRILKKELIVRENEDIQIYDDYL